MPSWRGWCRLHPPTIDLIHLEYRMTKVYSLKVKLSGGMSSEDAWTVKFEALDSMTLSDLHQAILRFVGFQNDHLYDFYSGRTWSSRKPLIPRGVFDWDQEDPDPDCAELTLADIYPLPEKHKLFYLFDFGDCWAFAITKIRSEKEPDPKAKYPRLMEETGIKPEQYGGFDDEDF
jgi:hypothetical protein